jgi:acyl-CoA-binding protein
MTYIKQHTQQDAVYRLSEAADLDPLCKEFGLSTRQLFRAAQRGELVTYKPGLYRMVRASHIQAWLESSRSDADK